MRSDTKHILVLLPVKDEERPLFESGAEGLEFTYSTAAAATADEVRRADVILGNPPMALLKNAPRLKLLHLNSAGIGGYGAPGVLNPGTILCNAAGAYGVALSEHMLGLALALSKKLHRYRDAQSAGSWNDLGPVGGIYGSTTLVVGFGDIGREFAKRMHALGSRVLAIKRTAGQAPDYAESLSTLDQLDELLPEADFVFLSLPETPKTRGLFDRARLARMKRGAILLNVGRGSAVDSDALCALLNDGYLAGAGLDVTEPEPLPASHPLWKCENALITPHVSGGFHMEETRRRIVRNAAANLHAFLEERPLSHIVDLKEGY